MSLKSIVQKSRLASSLCEKPYWLLRRFAGIKQYKKHVNWASDYPVSRLSPLGQHFFFGYYDKIPWSKDQDLLLGLNSAFAGKNPQIGDAANVTLMRADFSEDPVCIATTTAWCWQQGSMLQWISYKSDEAILFNQYHKGSYSTAIFNKEGEQLDQWPLPTFAISKDGLRVVSLDFSRLGYCASGYGYCAESFLQKHVPCPSDSGLLLWDVASRKKRLLLSLEQIIRHQPRHEFQDSYHYFAHADFNPSGTRIAFYHRWQRRNSPQKTRFFTIDIEKGVESLHLLADYDMTSHYTWTSDQTLIAWGNHQLGTKYYQFKDLSEAVPEPLGDEVLTEDGHPSISPDGQWMITDTYPDRYCQRHLLLYDLKKHHLYHVGRFLNPIKHWGACRCDLHPRWSPCGNYVCIDSVHEGFRGMYSVNVSSVVARNKGS